MYLTEFKFLSAGFILILTVLSGWFPFQKKQWMSNFAAGEALACGVFLGAGLLHMLSEGMNGFLEVGVHYPLGPLLAGGMFLFLLWLEHLGREVTLHQKKHRGSVTIVLLAVVMLCLHSLFEGMALGLGESIPEVTVMVIAILAHHLATSFALSVQLNKSDLKHSTAVVGFSMFAVMGPLGVFLGNFFAAASGGLLAPIAISLTAGTFLYIGTLHGLNRAVMIDRCCNLREFIFVILGFCLMAAVSGWV